MNSLFQLTHQAMTHRPSTAYMPPSLPSRTVQTSCPSAPRTPPCSNSFPTPRGSIYSRLMKNHDRVTQRHLVRT